MPPLDQAARYIVSGLAAAATHFAVMTPLIELAHVGPVTASAVGFAAAIAVNYVLQHRWVFRSTSAHGAAFSRYVAVTCLMMGLNLAVFALLQRGLGLHYLLAQAITTGVVALCNFQINRRFTFRNRAPGS